MNDLPARFWNSVVAWLGLFSVASSTQAGTMQDRNPVLLIHGIHDSASSMRILTNSLTRQGWEVYSLNLVPNNGSQSLKVLAQQVAEYADRHFAPGRKIDLVGFSMGGLVGRYYLQRLGGGTRVERFVSVAAPNHGSWMAWLSTSTGAREMRPGSKFLRDLNGDLQDLNALRLTVIWSPLDLMIIPADSSRLPIGKEVRLWIVAHPLLLLQGSALRAISQALQETP